ncbi:MAG: GFA family protein [Rubrobacter sp.]|nr:GFA family protein [Rubrobacter sp.]
MEDAVHEGGCFCGGVRYRTVGEPLSSDVCHCVSCRRASGAQSVAWLTFTLEGFSFVTGDPTPLRSSPGVTRTFCGTCGTSLTYQNDGDPDSIDVTTASLDRPETFPPTRHIWTEDRLAWVGVDEGLPQFHGSSSEDQEI